MGFSRKNSLLKVGDRVLLAIESIASGGEGVAKPDGFTVFVPFSAPGDIIDATIETVKKSYAVAKIISVEKESEMRVNAICPHFSICGGCQLQHIVYESQLEIKRRIVQDNISRIGGIFLDVKSVKSMPQAFNYRNKVQFVSANIKNKLTLGLYEKLSHKIVPVEFCPLQSVISNEVLSSIYNALPENWSSYNERTNKGSLRHIVIRNSSHGEALVILVSKTHLPDEKVFASKLIKSIPCIKGVVLNLNKDKTNVILGNENVLLCGEDFITEEIFGKKFKISSGSFFQVNYDGALTLAETVTSLFEKSEKSLLDAYCGGGFFSVILADRFNSVTGIEEFLPAVISAKQTAKDNDITNAEFYSGKVEKVLPEMISSGKVFDVCLFDPPRKGLEREVIDSVAQVKIPSIVYVSCNPSTLARDLKIFEEKGYITNFVQPVDMFPQTAHVECVAQLKRVAEG